VPEPPQVPGSSLGHAGAHLADDHSGAQRMRELLTQVRPLAEQRKVER
jgi:hypothetical protein